MIKVNDKVTVPDPDRSFLSEKTVTGVLEHIEKHGWHSGKTAYHVRLDHNKQVRIFFREELTNLVSSSKSLFVIRFAKSKRVLCKDKMWGYWFCRVITKNGQPMKKVITYKTHKDAQKVIIDGNLDGGEDSPSNNEEICEVVTLEKAIKDLQSERN